jgi:hypothetical protein
MNYFEDWYSQPNYENEEQENDLMKRWASMLQAAADIPSCGLRNDRQMNSGLGSDPSDFINGIVENNTIPQLVNRGIADINSWFEEPNDPPKNGWSLKDFLRKPQEPFDDSDFFDRNVPAKPFRDMAGDTGPDEDFWQPQPVNRDLADMDSWFEEPNDLPENGWSLKDFLRKPQEPFDDSDFFDPNVSANLSPNMTGSTGPDQDFWEPQPVDRDLADIDSWFEEPNDLPGKDWSLKDFLRKPEEPFDDSDFFDPNVSANLSPNMTGDTGPDEDFWELQSVNGDLAEIESWFEGPNDLPGNGWSLKDFLRKPEEPLGDLGFFEETVSEQLSPDMAGSTDLDRDMDSAQDIAQQPTDMDNAWNDYQPAVDEYSAYYDSEEPEADRQDRAFDNPEEDEEWDWDGEPDGSDDPDGSAQETQDSKKPETVGPDGLEQLKQRFLDQLMARDYSPEEALNEWQNLVNGYDSRGIAIVASQLGMDARLNLDEAKRMADSDKRMRDTAEVGGLALAVAGGLQAAGLGLRYAFSQAAKAEAARERGLVSLWKRVADYLPGGGAAGSEAAAPSVSGAAERRVWDLGPGPRGEAIEGALGKNLPSNHPVVDKFENGVAISIKSMDLGAKTYNFPGEIARIGRTYIDKVADFQGARWAGMNIEAENITGRALDLAVPPGATEAQRAALQGLIEYGAQNGVKVRIITVP